ncbi:MAG: metallophosphoesterase [Oscillochloridaceae bacterium]|nr:metallophosphoesterase [Chloroflexaceae bacterium]MDW8389156.1 metallophosphoesterase [Oscillochloridaceae bacterium]
MPQYAQPRTRVPAHAIIRALQVIGGAALLALALRWVFLRVRRVVLRPTDYTTPPIGPDAITPRQRRIVVSDLHLGGGDHLDDFTDDAALIAFLDHYVSGEPTELILAGDTIEFLQVRLPDLDDDEYSDAAAARRIETVIRAHAGVFAALARFVARPDAQLTLLIGNHDFELHYPAAKARLREALGLAPDDPRLRFGVSYHGGGIYIVHGNQFDGWNRFVHFDGVTEPFEVVRGTQMVKEVINDLEDEPLAIAPLIDNVKPSSALFWYLLALPQLRTPAARRFLARGVAGFLQVVAWPEPHQMPITGEGPGGMLSAPALRGFWRWTAGIRRGRVARHREVARQVGMVASAVEPPGEMIDQVQSEATRQAAREVRAFNDRCAREMLRIARSPAHRDDTLFICGHTHLAGIVPLGMGQYYINTGTWTEIIYDIATMRRQEQRFPFLEITYPDGPQPRARLLVWIDPETPPQPWREGAILRLPRHGPRPTSQTAADRV